MFTYLFWYGASANTLLNKKILQPSLHEERDEGFSRGLGSHLDGGPSLWLFPTQHCIIISLQGHNKTN